ncbi:MAG: phosphatidylglycerol lysyltransferase domain-containing protein [Eubacteriales bacterium]
MLFLLWIGEPPGHHLTHIARWFLDSFAVIEIIGLVYGVSMILRPVIYRRRILPYERKRALNILTRFGHSPLAYLTLLPDKLFFFSNSGKSYAAYTLVGNVAIVLGDPIGPKDDLSQLVSQFKETCLKNDWHLVFYQALPDNLPAYHNMGFKSLKIGEEAIIDLKMFSMEGSQRKGIRQSVNNLSRKGFKTKINEPPLNDLTLKQLKEVSDEWLHLQHGSEKRFSLGWFDVQYLKNCTVITVSDAQDKIVAFANPIPEYNHNEGTIDLMRRRDNKSGIMDLLFVRLIEYLKEQGYQSFNLGLSPLAGVGTKPEDSFQEKFLNFFYDHFNQLYSFKGLHFFKDKFDPFWEPRYLIYLNPIFLPKIAIAITTANAGGNLLKTYLSAWWGKKRSAD